MRFEKHLPAERLRPYIKYYVVSETEARSEYKVFPAPGIVIGFQYRGNLAIVENTEVPLATAGISGIADHYKVFRNSPNIGTILVYFSESGFAHFGAPPAHELFNLSVSLDQIFDKWHINEVEEKLSSVTTDKQRLKIVEQFLLSQMRDIKTDNLVDEAVRLIYQSNGTIRINELNQKLLTSQSPLEKRFRAVVGSSPKKFASIVRFNCVLNNLKSVKSLTQICYEKAFFDQAHFIKDFKQFTGSTPDSYKRLQ